MPSANEMLDMSKDELDDLYRSSPPGDIPRGEGEGTVIFSPDTALADIAAKLAHLIVWKGKVFDPERGELLNEITPLGVDSIRAKVFHGESQLDGGPCIVLDYAETSIIAHWIRDEMRLVDKGTYLGLVYWGDNLILRFALEFPPD